MVSLAGAGILAAPAYALSSAPTHGATTCAIAGDECTAAINQANTHGGSGTTQVLAVEADTELHGGTVLRRVFDIRVKAPNGTVYVEHVLRNEAQDSVWFESVAEGQTGGTPMAVPPNATTPNSAPATSSGPHCSATLPQGTVVGLASTANGYWIVDSAGTVVTCGSVANYGSLSPAQQQSPVVGIAATPDGKGYFLVEQNGNVVPFGDAVNHGSMSGQHLNGNIVGIAVDPATGGYWLVGSDGGIFAFDAPFFGSTGALHLNKPIVGIVATHDGKGYYFVAADGGVFTFGNANFYGSVPGKLAPNQTLKGPIVGIAVTPSGLGYWMVASDGGVFSFGDAQFKGSAGNLQLAYAVTGISSVDNGQGYRLVASDGGVFDYNAPFYGSAS